MVRTIAVVPYDPAWPSLFEEEAARLLAILGEEALAIHHIGSTSIPGLAAKPIIDVLLVVRSLEKLDEFNAKLIELGYLPKGEYGIAGRRFFIKGDELHRSHHIHAFTPGQPEIESHVNLRDYLRSHPEEAKKYGSLKGILAKQFPNDIDAYMAGKDAFVKDIVRKAQVWREHA